MLPKDSNLRSIDWYQKRTAKSHVTISFMGSIKLFENINIRIIKNLFSQQSIMYVLLNKLQCLQDEFAQNITDMK
jgi:hypothetical protein